MTDAGLAGLTTNKGAARPHRDPGRVHAAPGEQRPELRGAEREHPFLQRHDRARDDGGPVRAGDPRAGAGGPVRPAGPEAGPSEGTLPTDTPLFAVLTIGASSSSAPSATSRCSPWVPSLNICSRDRALAGRSGPLISRRSRPSGSKRWRLRPDPSWNPGSRKELRYAWPHSERASSFADAAWGGPVIRRARVAWRLSPWS